MKRRIQLTVNDELHDLDVEPSRLLLELLRDDLGLTGTKEGCGIGVCGACSVLVDDRLISACLTLAVACGGTSVTTIEGLAHDGELHPLQRAFHELGGMQCGICTPGQIIAARALLEATPHPTEEEVREWMAGNLCRCTGYYKIVDAILAAAEGQAPAEGSRA